VTELTQPEKGAGRAVTWPYAGVRACGGWDALPWRPQGDDGAPSGIEAVRLRAQGDGLVWQAAASDDML
jgi:hypothetical protein